ncbi:hypothetical protein GCM10023189_26070 [Nibrella saemangeumensis]|uniref:Uncharacterized protein n=1 Tax=Nibrella saemangeumensis TaxID=1084526 RepID=A0ABP8MUZ7_9BACT
MESEEQVKIDKEWEQLMAHLQQVIGKRPADLNGVLFLIGVQELGKGPRHFTKEQKQDLMHIAVCKVLSLGGYYQQVGTDPDGWPQWQLVRPVPHADLLAQEDMLKVYVIKYFASQQIQ